MSLKAIKISDHNYRWLCTIAGEIQAEEGRPVSIDEAITIVRKGGKITDLAGSWKMSDKEAANMIKDIRRGWKKWRIASV